MSDVIVPLIGKTKGFSFESFVPKLTCPVREPTMLVSSRSTRLSDCPGEIVVARGSTTENPVGIDKMPVKRLAVPSLRTLKVTVGPVEFCIADPKLMTVVCPLVIDVDP